MAVRRDHTSLPPDLFAELIDVLLSGWAAGANRPESQGDDAFRVFEYSDEGLRDVWRRHRPALLAEAARRGLPRPVWAELRYEIDPPPWLTPPAA